MNQSIHEKFMKQALWLAKISASLGEVPVGAVVVVDEKIVGRGFNQRELKHSPLAHAEIYALEDASNNLARWRLTDAIIYTNLEPCIMCAGALLHARIKCLVFGASDKKFGAVESLYNLGCDQRLNHQFSIISGVLAEESCKLLKDFFNVVRKKT